jgi:acetylornithine deacetylase
MGENMRKTYSEEKIVFTDKDRSEMRALLRQCIAFKSTSGNESPFVQFLTSWAADRGLDVDIWDAGETDLTNCPVVSSTHLPLSGRSTAVICLAGTGEGRSLIFNGHTDVVAAGNPSNWSHDPWSGADVANRIYGRGACDVKGAIISALWAMTRLAQLGNGLKGNVLLELVPGEEDCVGLGTFTSVARRWRPDACVVLEPTECQPKCASRGGVRFEISVLGTAVHGSVKWFGKDAIADARRVLNAIEAVEKEWNTIDEDRLYSAYPIARPLTVDSVRGGEWQGMLCDRCTISGYMELLPGDEIAQWMTKLESSVRQHVGATVRFMIQYREAYPGHWLSPNHPLCQAARPTIDHTEWEGFNAGCEAGLRANLLGTPTLVWGPGSLAQAHAADEFVSFDEVEDVAMQFMQLALRWCNKE